MWHGLGILKEEWQRTPKAVQIVFAYVNSSTRSRFAARLTNNNRPSCAGKPFR